MDNWPLRAFEVRCSEVGHARCVVIREEEFLQRRGGRRDRHTAQAVFRVVFVGDEESAGIKDIGAIVVEVVRICNREFTRMDANDGGRRAVHGVIRKGDVRKRGGLLYEVVVLVIPKGGFPLVLVDDVGEPVHGVEVVVCCFSFGIYFLKKVSVPIICVAGDVPDGVGDGGYAALGVESEGDGVAL